MVHPDILFGRLGNRMFQMAYIYSQMKKKKIDDIFIQDPKHFIKYKDEIKKLFSEGIGLLPYTAIHLRVGKNPLNPAEPKYSENPFYTSMIKTGYYIKALEHIPHGKCIIFSDDIAVAKTYFEGDRFAFDESETDIEALNKMASCQNLIGTNSSFSWWAGFLNPHIDAKIIFPKEESWFADGVVRTKLMPEWLTIDP